MTRPYPLLITILVSAVLLVSLTCGCGTLRDVVNNTAQPSAEIQAIRLIDWHLDQATLEFDVKIENPCSFAVPLVDLDYSLVSGGREFLSGTAPLEGSVRSRKSRTITLPAQVSYADAITVARTIRPGAVIPYVAELSLSVEAPALGSLTLPLRKAGALPIPTVPVIELESVEWESLSLNRATAMLRIRVENTNQFPFDLSTLDYGLSLGGTNVVNASIRQAASVDAGAVEMLEIPISLAPIKLGVAVFNTFRGDESGYELGGTMRVDTAYGPIEFPFHQMGSTTFTH